MLRQLQVEKDKPIAIQTAAAELTTGAVVGKDHAGNLSALASGLGDYLVDAPKDFTGLNSILYPTDRASATIASGAKCQAIATRLGERYATSEATPGYLDKGDPMNASSGKLIKASSASAYQWVYGGTYSDPVGTLYIVERVEQATAPATRTVTYDKNSGTGTMTDARSPYYVGKVATVLANGFTAPTYKDFVDYDTAANGSGTNYAPGATITIAGSNIVLYAQYANSHTLLVLDANTGTGTMSDATKYYTDEIITVPESTFTPPDAKVFSKWNTLANGTGTDYLPDAEITVTSGMIGAATTLYAIWADA
jgi:hypothetical protein